MRFKSILLSELAANIPNAIVGGPFGSNLVSADYVESGVPVIRGQNMGLGRWVDGEFVFVSEEKARQLSPNIARPGDLVFTQRGTLGQVAIVPKSRHHQYLVSQSQMKITVDPAEADVLFLYYLFNTPQQQHYIKNNAIQTGVPHTNLSILKHTPLKLPSLSVQREIATILGSFDDKIELNRKMDASLEQIIQTLFKSWFVDFDPVKAKFDERVPEGMDAVMAELFPNEFEERGLGKIPKGWQIGELRDICHNYREGVNPSDIEPDTPYIGLEHMPRKSIALDAWGTVSQAESGKSRFRAGDILFGKLRPYFHKVGVAPVDGVCSTDILVIRPIRKEYFGIALSYLSSVELINHADKLSNGAKMPRVRWGDLATYKIVIPPIELANQFSEIVFSASRKIRENILESKVLVNLRETLLPRLISGQIPIPDEPDEGGFE